MKYIFSVHKYFKRKHKERITEVELCKIQVSWVSLHLYLKQKEHPYQCHASAYVSDTQFSEWWEIKIFVSLPLVIKVFVTATDTSLFAVTNYKLTRRIMMKRSLFGNTILVNGYGNMPICGWLSGWQSPKSWWESVNLHTSNNLFLYGLFLQSHSSIEGIPSQWLYTILISSWSLHIQTT